VRHEAMPGVTYHNHKGWISRDVGTNAKAAKESLGGSGSETSEHVARDQPKRDFVFNRYAPQ